ncbi:MAG TPA: hypothetical protein VLA72_01415 [Anaerolineales bacterium]|nr:hypothetical protein [Anaerolineales bacterium]
MKNFRPLIFFVILLLIVGMACNAVTGDGGDAPQSQPDEPPAPAQQDPEPDAPPPTEEPAPEPTEPAQDPTEPAPELTEAPVVSKFFVEEFESGFLEANWDFFTLGDGEESNLVIEQEDDHLLFDLGDENLYVYYLYIGDVYDDVDIKLNAENRGRNNNNVSLICDFDADAGEWYEFSVESGGLWYLYAFQGGYNVIDNGGTNALKQGKEVNEYGMTCDGNEITMTVNGDTIKTVTDNTYNLGEGLVGFNISSLNVLPITVEVNWFEISEP